jgi:hypothetical protein
LKEPGWKLSLVINFVGMIGTAIVATIIAGTKFLDGAWISIVVMALLMGVFVLIRRHYDWYEEAIRLDEEAPRMTLPTTSAIDPNARRDIVIVPVDAVTKITAGAIAMAREISANVTAVHLSDDREDAERFRERWDNVMPDVPLLVIESPYRAFAAPMLAYIESLEHSNPDRAITVILPGFKAHHWWEGLLHNRAIRRLKPYLAAYPSVRVVEFDYDVERGHHRAKPPAPAAASA